jgi:hypothetical protein
MIRGEWFDISPRRAEAFIEASIRLIRSWGIDQEGMLKLMEHWERKQPSTTSKDRRKKVHD